MVNVRGFLSGVLFNLLFDCSRVLEYAKIRTVLQSIDMEIIFYSRADKTHFHKKDCAPSLILKVRVFGTQKWPIDRRIVSAKAK